MKSKILYFRALQFYFLIHLCVVNVTLAAFKADINPQKCIKETNSIKDCLVELIFGQRFTVTLFKGTLYLVQCILTKKYKSFYCKFHLKFFVDLDQHQAVKFLKKIALNNFQIKSRCKWEDLSYKNELSFVKYSAKKGLFIFDVQTNFFHNLNYSGSEELIKCSTLHGIVQYNNSFD
jgi:hypothetical protein